MKLFNSVRNLGLLMVLSAILCLTATPNARADSDPAVNGYWAGPIIMGDGYNYQANDTSNGGAKLSYYNADVSYPLGNRGFSFDDPTNFANGGSNIVEGVEDSIAGMGAAGFNHDIDDAPLSGISSVESYGTIAAVWVWVSTDGGTTPPPNTTDVYCRANSLEEYQGREGYFEFYPYYADQLLDDGVISAYSDGLLDGDFFFEYDSPADMSSFFNDNVGFLENSDGQTLNLHPQQLALRTGDFTTTANGDALMNFLYEHHLAQFAGNLGDARDPVFEDSDFQTTYHTHINYISTGPIAIYSRLGASTDYSDSGDTTGFTPPLGIQLSWSFYINPPDGGN